MELIFDLESDGLLDTITRVWCVSVLNIDDPQKPLGYRPTNLTEALEHLDTADTLIGHNIIAFDLPALKKVFGWEPRPDVTIIDTLCCCNTIWPHIAELDVPFNAKMTRRGFPMPKQYLGKHSLAAWGWRLGERKMDYNDWTAFSEEMLTYNIQDVVVNYTLYQKILSKGFPLESLLRECKLHAALQEQTAKGVMFNYQAAHALAVEVKKEVDKLEDEIVASFPATTKQLKTKVKTIPFNPRSRVQISNQLMAWGWKPKKNSKGKPWRPGERPKLDEKVIQNDLGPLLKEHPEVALINTYFLRSKLHTTIVGNPKKAGTGWVNMEVNGKLHGIVHHMGAVTSRCSHQRPNLAQVPNAKSPYGLECRELFFAPEGYTMVGSDAAGLELRMLGHYMAAYDDGEYAHEVVNGDVHTKNQLAAGLPTRDNAKTFIYAFLYGAGPDKIGSIVGKGKSAGQELIDEFLKATPALAKLRRLVAKASERGYLIGLDGRHIPVRSQHAALNTLLQGGGAIVCKEWYLRSYAGYKQAEIDGYIALFVHDETQSVIGDPYVETASNILQRSMEEVSTFFNLKVPLRADVKIGRNWRETH